MDCAVKSLEKTSDIERKTTINKLHNMQWLKNTSHSANPGKIKAVVCKQDENEKTEDKVSALTKTIETHLSEDPDKYSSRGDTCKTYLCSNTMPESDENVWSKNINTVNLFSNAEKLTDQKNEEDMLSIVESIVTAKLEAQFYTNKEHKDQISISENNAKDIIQDPVCTNSSDLQKTEENAGQLKLIKNADGNNNDSQPIIPCMSKMNDKQKSTCKITSIENNKASMEAKDKDAHVKTNNMIKTDIMTGNSNLIKNNEKSSSPSNDSKKTVSNSLKSPSASDKNGKDNKQNNAKIACTRKEFVKQRSVSRNGTEKEIKNTIAKSNLAKTGIETIGTICQNKNSNKPLQKQQQQTTLPKQCTTKSKGQECLKKNGSMLNSCDDKNKMEKMMHTPENVESSLKVSERKNEKIVNEKNVQSDQKPNRSIDFRKNTTFVAQYKNSTFSKSMQNPRIGQSPMYGRNSYSYNNSKFDRDRNSVERRVTKKEHTPTNTFAKSNTGTEELHTSNLEDCAKQKEEIIQPINIKSTCGVDTLMFNDKKDINPAKTETHLVQSKENTSSNIDQGSTSEQHHVETNISKIDIDQQHKETNNEETASFKHPSNVPSNKYDTNPQINVIHQYSLKLENMQRTNDINQLESVQTIWNQSDNAAQKDAIVNLQQSVNSQNMHFNTQQTFTPAGNPTRQMPTWEPNNSKFYDQQFSVSDAMRLSQIPNINAPPYEYSASVSSDNNVTATSTLETMSNNRENSNVFYRYGSNVQQRPVMASDFPGHSMSPCQTNQARWSSSVDSFEHPYVAMQPAMMHVYNPAVFGPDDFNNTMDYVSHPVIYAPSPYMQTWNSQLHYPMPVLYNSPCTFSHDHQPHNFNNSIHDQQHKHNPYAQINNYVRDTYNDTNTCAAHARNTVDNVPMKSNYYKKHQDSRATYDVPQYVPPISYSRSQQGMHFMPATDINQYVPYRPPNQKHCRHNPANYMKNPKCQMQDFACDDGSEDAPPIISPKEFVTNDINLLNKTDQIATRVFRPEFKKSNSGYRPPSSYPRYSYGIRRNTTIQDFPKEYTYPVSLGRGTYKTKKI